MFASAMKEVIAKSPNNLGKIDQGTYGPASDLQGCIELYFDRIS